MSSFRVNPETFSPDGDGKTDTTAISYALVVDSVAVSIVVFEDDSATVVDTIVTDANQMAGVYRDKYSWDGEDYLGVPVVEGRYVIRFHAQKDAQDTTIITPVWVDVTAPQLIFHQRVPSVYVPGVPTQPQTVQIVFEIRNSTAPGGVPAGDVLTGEVFTPAGAASQDSVVIDPPFAGDGLYTAKWTVTNFITLKDGDHVAKIRINDYAQHRDSVIAPIDVDAEGPEIKITSLDPDQTLAVIPSTLEGFMYDRHGIDPDSVAVRYDRTSPKQKPYYMDIRADSLHFRMVLADSIVDEREWTLFFDSADLYEKGARFTFKIKFDKTAPAAPTLDPFTGVSHGPVFELTGSWEGTPERIRVYRSGVLVDSIFTVVESELNIRVPLETGRNILTATAVDAANNESPPSNAVDVYFDDATGLYIPAPFRPSDEFQLNLTREATRATLRLYDLGGDMVIALDEFEPEKNYLFAWNGLNGSGTAAKKGPLVAVAEVTFENGEKTIFREIFLFDPAEN